MVFGNDPTVNEIVWTGPQTLLHKKAEAAGVKESFELKKLMEFLTEAVQKGRKVHYLRQYRPENILKIEQLLAIPTAKVNPTASIELMKAVIEQRSVKAKEEIAEIEIGVNITCEMQLAAMKHTKPGMIEREIAGLMHGIALARGGDLSFPIIFSIHGETLHNHSHHNKMKKGDLVVNDCGAESALQYAGDLTRTFPVSGKFTAKQKEIYEIVLKAQKNAIAMIAPAVKFKDVHLTACRTLFDGLKELGLMKGNTDEAVKAGAHAIFFQCGTGHMMGLDVHDMENLGEEFIGYDENVHRSEQFGMCYLRMAKPLQPAYKEQLNHFINIKIRGNNVIEQLYAKYMPVPFLSVLIDDCIAKGIDYNAGGARYNTNYIQGVGLGTMTNCLTAVKHNVFDHKKMTMPEMLHALQSDFNGNEALRLRLINKTPKYGNDDPEADNIMLQVFEIFYNEVNGRPNTKGGKYRINLLPTTCHIYFGSVTGALPDGRKAWTPLSEGISPVQGADRRGPTAALKSAGKMDHVRTGGTLLNQKFSPSLLENEKGIDNLSHLVRSYFTMGGHHIQFNVVNAQTLREAQKYPEQYRDLIVRVAGYSDYFCDLGTTLQDEIIARTEHAAF
jgi:Xaa-Pro aminopeptidase